MPISNIMSQNILSPAEIAGKKFEKSRMGGYRPVDVDAFLDEIASSVSALTREITELKKKLEAANKKISELQNDEVSLSQALLNAQRLADSILKDSREKADLTLRDAEIKAENIREKAVSATQTQKEELEKAKRETTAFKHVILDMYKRQVEMILKIPDDADKPQDDKKAEAQQILSPEQTNVSSAGDVEQKVSEEEPKQTPLPDEKPEKEESKPEPSTVAPTVEKPARELNIRFKEAATTDSTEKTTLKAPEPLKEQEEPLKAPEEKKAEKPKFRLNLKYDEQSGEYIPDTPDDKEI